MMNRRILLFAALVTLALLTAAQRLQPTLLNKVDTRAMNAWVDSAMQRMTPDERIAQLMVVAVFPNDNAATRQRVKHLVEDCKVGGLIYHEGTMSGYAAVTNYAQSLASIPLLMTIDGEWGLAMRVKDIPAFPRNLRLGAVDDDRLLYQYGREVARQMRRLGIHVNFAPVLDVNDTPSNPVIGTRSFGESPEMVSRHAIAYARGLEDGGVLSVGKHFPGHGSSVEDSHKTLPVIDKSMREINTCELVPFRNYIEAGLSGMLTAHLYVPAIDKNEVATTMSRRCVTDLLVQRLGFNGLIFTDALGMEGAKKNQQGSPCVNALLAGNDVLLMPEDVEAEIRAVRQAIDADTLSQKMIDAHCRKVLQYKYVLGLNRRQSVNTSHLADDINTNKTAALIRQLTAASVTVVKNTDGTLPVADLQHTDFAVVTVGLEGGLKSAFHLGADHYAAVRHYHMRYGESGNLAAQLADKPRNHVIVAVSDQNGANVSAVTDLVEKCPRVTLVILNEPYDIAPYAPLMAHKHVKAALLTYHDDDVTQDYAVQTIFGGNPAQGVLPISLQCGNRTLQPGHGIHYKACRLGFALPAQVGINNRLLQQIDSVVNEGLRQKAFPGCQVLVARHGKVVCCRSYGEINFGSGVRVDDNTLFGLASVSKATGTLSAVMRLYDQGKFSLGDVASKYIPGLRRGDKMSITMRDLLYHETGMPPSLNMWTMMMDPATYSGKLMTNQRDTTHTIQVMKGAWGHNGARLRTDILSTTRTDRFDTAIADGIWGGKVTYDSIMNRIYQVRLGTKKYVYSCLNFCLLADAAQRLTHLPLDTYVQQEVFAPLGAYHTVYRPLDHFPREQIAYTEVDTYLRRQHIHGYVHDELAAFSGGVQGNAGLFSNACDLAKLFQMWLNGGEYGGQRYLKASTVSTFLTQKSPNSHRGLGFDKPVMGNPKASNTCAEATAATVGHTGFTGTCFWIDPQNDMFYIFLSNRVCPTRDNPAFSRVSARSHIQSLIYKNLEQ